MDEIYKRESWQEKGPSLTKIFRHALDLEHEYIAPPPSNTLNKGRLGFPYFNSLC